MPVAAPVIAALITAGVSGTEMGLQASGAFQPSTSGDVKKQQMMDAQKQQQQNQTMEQSMFKRFAPDAQAQSGGALGDQSLSAMIAELAGQPGDINLAHSTIFGDTGSTSPAGGSGLSSTPVGG